MKKILIMVLMAFAAITASAHQPSDMELILAFIQKDSAKITDEELEKFNLAIGRVTSVKTEATDAEIEKVLNEMVKQEIVIQARPAILEYTNRPEVRILCEVPKKDPVKPAVVGKVEEKKPTRFQRVKTYIVSIVK
jgi:hypothetical protein